ncbi:MULTISPECIES: 16S rRNA (cytosine(967)-C(5))-methyltransferase RsmB [Bacillus]|uniref:16S rRNA (cytosine(967)-C(5))-methyltransferase RsmB n=1 Tax=Bacillus TaxID=1386 RepID=UPI0002E32FEF|nr:MULTISPECIES: 16S rRNA (cytosine(967)-C(5))-methyltransferase RsmB [Bacillus]
MSKNKSKGVRELALDLILSVEKNQAYSNLLLNKVINKNQLSAADSRLLTEITYGTIQRKLTLDYFLQPFVKNNAKMDDWVRILLRLSVYQMHYLDKIPDHAILFEAVEIAKKRGHKGISSMVNGVLRNIQRKGLPSFELINNDEERISVETSHPLWLVERWIKQYGVQKTKEMCESNLYAPHQTARINVAKITREKVMEKLEEEGFSVKVSEAIPEGIVCLQGNLAHSQAFKDGLLSIQDESSILVAHALGVNEKDRILDCCAAPGGKTTSIAERLPQGSVVALDLHDHKVKLIEQQAKRLGLANIATRAFDARKSSELFEEQTFDKILVDAPCSGLGVMRRKPDVKYTKSEADIERLAAIQKDILNATAPLLKAGGTLVYSTCTVDQEENDEVVKSFLLDHPEFVKDNEFKNRLPEKVRPFIKENALQLFPQDIESDGFFIACFRKKD